MSALSEAVSYLSAVVDEIREDGKVTESRNWNDTIDMLIDAAKDVVGSWDNT